MLAFCKCREAPETESFFCGLLRAGQRTRVEQTCRLPSGLLRVRTRLGWASVVSTSGEPLLKMLGIVQHTDEDEAADLERAGEVEAEAEGGVSEATPSPPARPWVFNHAARASSVLAKSKTPIVTVLRPRSVRRNMLGFPRSDPSWGASRMV